MNKNELLKKMEEAMDRYDLSCEIEKARIGEWQYGVAMVPCDWVYEYVKQPEIVRCKDCKYDPSTGYPKEELPYWYPCKNGMRDQDWFCGYGERR